MECRSVPTDLGKVFRRTSTPPKTCRILVVDDHPVVREGLCAMLSGDQRLEIVGTVESGKTALEKLRELEPDVVLLDILMPGMSGIEVTRQIKSAEPFPKLAGFW